LCECNINAPDKLHFSPCFMDEIVSKMCWLKYFCCLHLLIILTTLSFSFPSISYVIKQGLIMSSKSEPLSSEYSNSQLIGLSLLRVLIGWHFLYEGVAKLSNPHWSSAAFLLDTKWALSGIANSLVSNPSTLNIVDHLNMWGLTAIGLSLMCGLFSRWGSLAGALLLLLYYLFHPPLVGLEYSKPTEGSYLLIDKNLVEACALFVLAKFPTGHITGLDRFLQRLRR